LTICEAAPADLPVHAASNAGGLASLEVLLRAGANPEIQADRGQTAIDFARAQNHPAIVERLAR